MTDVLRHVKAFLDEVAEYSDLYEPIHGTLMGSLPGIVIYFVKSASFIKWIALILVLAPLITLFFAYIGRVVLREHDLAKRLLVASIVAAIAVVSCYIAVTILGQRMTTVIVILITLVNGLCIVVAREINVLKSARHVAESALYTACMTYIVLVCLLGALMWLLAFHVVC
ncbi:MAG: hypothetical protein GXO23_06330 [Crenarchaeota archaeon]|nr:hypothetical protein [Thermoproteota archaeon]